MSFPKSVEIPPTNRVELEVLTRTASDEEVPRMCAEPRDQAFDFESLVRSGLEGGIFRALDIQSSGDEIRAHNARPAAMDFDHRTVRISRAGRCNRSRAVHQNRLAARVPRVKAVGLLTPGAATTTPRISSTSGSAMKIPLPGSVKPPSSRVARTRPVASRSP